MTVKDGFKLGIGIALGFAVVGGVMGAMAGIFSGIKDRPSVAVYESSAPIFPPAPVYPVPKGAPETWGCGRQCRLIDKGEPYHPKPVEVCVDNPPCPKP